MLSKYRTFFEANLHITIEEITQAKGIVLYSHEKMRSNPVGWSTYMPVCAFVTEQAALVSCIPEWANELREVLAGAAVSEATPRMNEFASKRDYLVDQNLRVYGIESPISKIDCSRAVPLDCTHFAQHWEFMERAYPSTFGLIESDKQMEQDFMEIVSGRTDFCVFVGGEIVSLAASESMPNKPEGIVNLGINTLSGHRRNGYAAAACAAFINHHVQRGLMTIWQCDPNNAVSRLLAEKLGFRRMGDFYSISSLVECSKETVH